MRLGKLISRLKDRLSGADLRDGVSYERAVSWISSHVRKTGRTLCFFPSQMAKECYVEKKDVGRLLRLLERDGKIRYRSLIAYPLRLEFIEAWPQDDTFGERLKRPPMGERPLGADLPKGTRRAIRRLLSPDGGKMPLEAVRKCYRSASAEAFRKAALAIPYEDYLTTTWWLSIRAEVLERDGYQCRRCSKGHTRLEVHHRTYEHKGAEIDHLEDLVTLCSSCHRMVHGRNGE